MKYYHPLAALMVLHILFLLSDAYSAPHLDSVMHLAGGISLGMCVLGVLAFAVSREWCPDPGKFVALVLAVSLVATGAVCWECYEWVSDFVFGTHLQPTVNDTVKDLFLGLLGGAIYAVYVFITRPSWCLVNTSGKAGSAFRSEG